MKRQTITCLIINLGHLPSHPLEQVLRSTDTEIHVVVAARHDELLKALEQFPNLVFYPASREQARGKILTKMLQHYSPDSVLVRVTDTQWHKPVRTRQGVDVFTIATQHPTILQSQIDFLLHYAELKQHYRNAKQMLGIAELRSQWLVDHSREAIAYVSNNQHIHANTAYLALMGLNSDEDAHATTLSDLVARDQQGLVLPLARDAERLTRPAHRLVTTLRPLGKPLLRCEVRFLHSVYRGQRCAQLHINPIRNPPLPPDEQPNAQNAWSVQNAASDLTEQSAKEPQHIVRLQLHETLNLRTPPLPPLYIADNLTTDIRGRTINQRVLLPQLTDPKKRLELDRWNLQHIIQRLPNLIDKHAPAVPQVLVPLGEWIWLSTKARQQLIEKLRTSDWVEHLVLTVRYDEVLKHWDKVQESAPEFKDSQLLMGIDYVPLDCSQLAAMTPLFNTRIIRLEQDIGLQIAHDQAVSPELTILLEKLKQQQLLVVVDGITNIASMNLLSGSDAAYLHGRILERLSQ